MLWGSLLLSAAAHGGEIRSYESEAYILLFDESLVHTAKEVIQIYPRLKQSLENTFAWRMSRRPSILIVNHDRFRNMAESPLTVAFAVPKKNLIALDYSRIKAHPFSLELTLKHELCHLLLHEHIPTVMLPRWLDEGVAQWVSDGLVDIVMDQRRSHLNRVVLQRSFIPFHRLERGFPYQETALILSYEQSKSFISHIIGKFGKKGILDVLNHMKNGRDVNTAFSLALAVTLDDLEQDWHHALRRRVTWFTYFSYHLYEILFGLMAVITVAGFIRILIKKRKYRDEDWDEPVTLH